MDLNTSAAHFDELGYMVIPGLLTRPEAGELYDAFEQVTEGRRSANERMLLRDGRFLDVVRRPALMDAARSILGEDLQLLAYDSLETPPHSGEVRAWHADFTHPVPATICFNTAIYLTDMTTEMGPLNVVPGSHRWGRLPAPEQEHQRLDGEVAVSVRAGDAVLFDAQLWHSGGRNESDRPRRAVFAYLGHYWMKRMDEFFQRPLPADVTESDDPLTRQLFGLQLTVPSAHGEDYRAGNPRWS